MIAIPRPDLRCERGHALREWHGLEDGVGYRLLCPVCDADYIKELTDARVAALMTDYQRTVALLTKGAY